MGSNSHTKTGSNSVVNTPRVVLFLQNIVFSGGANINTWSWTSNQTVNFYTDIFNIYDDTVDARGFSLTVNQYYW